MLPLVHIVDDDAQVRAAIACLLSSNGFGTEIYSGADAFLREAKLEGGCVVLDLRMPDMSGHEVQQELARRGAQLPVIVMSGHGDLGAAVRAMKLGAADFLQKPPREEDLLAAVKRALAGFEQDQGRRNAKVAAAAAVERLSRRERQILQGLLGGLSNKAIARRLDLSPRTVEMHRANMMNTLGTASLSEALRLAIDAALPPFGSEAPAIPPAPQIASLAAPAAEEPEAIRRAYEEKLRLALEASGDGAWDWDMVSGRIELSASLIERIGLVYGSLPDRIDRLEALMHPADRDQFCRLLGDHLEDRSAAFACEYRLRNGAGAWRWTEVRGRVVDRDPAGVPLRMVGTARDVSDRKAEEERGRQSAELLALVQRGAGGGTWDLDLDARRLHLCDRGVELNAVRPAPDAKGTSLEAWARGVHPEDLTSLVAAIGRAAATGEPISAEYRVRRPDGSCRWLLAIGTVVDSGERRRLVGLIQDVSARKRDAMDLSLAQNAMVDLGRERAIGTIGSTLAHELNQPLTAISYFVRGIRNRLASGNGLGDAMLGEAVEGAERSARVAADIVARLSRQMAGADSEREPASLSTIVRDACALALGESRDIALSFDLDEGADRVAVDPVQIEQLILNLVRNAADALLQCPATARRLHVSSARTSRDKVLVRVEDSGPGIAPEARARLFEPFFTTKAAGTGIGLPICRTIAEAHGGRIWAEASPIGGAALCFSLWT